MGMGMMFEFLIPGVKHAKEADLGAEMFGIASDFEEGFGTGLHRFHRMVLMTLYATGLRRAELAHLQIPDTICCWLRIGLGTIWVTARS